MLKFSRLFPYFGLCCCESQRVFNNDIVPLIFFNKKRRFIFLSNGKSNEIILLTINTWVTLILFELGTSVVKEIATKQIQKFQSEQSIENDWEEWKGEKRKKKKGEMKVRMGLSSPSL